MLVTGSVIPFSGCLGDGDAGDTTPTPESDDVAEELTFPSYDRPIYAAWPPAEPRTSDYGSVGHLNTYYLHEEADDDELDEDEPPFDADDVLLTMPFYGMFVTFLWYVFGFWGYPWNSTLGGEDEPNWMTTTAMTMTEGTFIFHGTYDSEMFTHEYSDGFDVREEGSFTIFEGRPDDWTDELAFAVSSDAVVVATTHAEVGGHDELVATLQGALTNHETESGRILDTEDGAWLFESTGPADLASCFWVIDGLEREHLELNDEDADEDAASIADNPVFERVDSFVSSLAFPEADGGVGGDMAAARFAALYPPGEVPTEEELRDGLLSADTAANAEVEITTGEDRVHVQFQVPVDEVDSSRFGSISQAH